MKKIIILVLLAFSFFLVSCKNDAEIESINKSIDNLEKIDDDSQKMLEIIKIEKEIDKLPSTKMSKLKIDKIRNEEMIVLSSLKKALGEKNFFLDDSYYLFEELIDPSYTNFYKVIGYSQIDTIAYEYRIDDESFNSKLSSLINVPFAKIDISNDENIITNILRENTNSTDRKKAYYINRFINDKLLLEIMIHPTCYIVVYPKIKGEDYFLRDKSAFISLIRVDYDNFYNFLKKENLEEYHLVNKYDNTIEFFTNEYLSAHTISRLYSFVPEYSNALVLLYDINSINQVLSFFDLKEELFGKEIYSNDTYISHCLPIYIDVETSNGDKEKWNIWISEEGTVFIKKLNDSYIYYTKTDCIDYSRLVSSLLSYAGF